MSHKNRNSDTFLRRTDHSPYNMLLSSTRHRDPTGPFMCLTLLYDLRKTAVFHLPYHPPSAHRA